DHAVEDGAREEQPLAVGVERHPWLERQDHVPEDEEDYIKDEQGSRILPPVLGAAVEALFEPTEEAPRPVLSIHDPGHIPAQGESYDGRCEEKQKGKQPGLHKHRLSSFLVT